jgi:hypothetical protein
MPTNYLLFLYVSWWIFFFLLLIVNRGCCIYLVKSLNMILYDWIVYLHDIGTNKLLVFFRREVKIFSSKKTMKCRWKTILWHSNFFEILWGRCFFSYYFLKHHLSKELNEGNKIFSIILFDSTRRKVTFISICKINFWRIFNE